MSTVKRLDPKERKNQVLEAAIKVAERVGYTNMQRDEIAKTAGCSPARVSQLFNTMTQLRRAVMRHAVQNDCHAIIAQGLVVKDKQALKASPEVRNAALAAML